VPKERFTSYPGASPDSDDSLLLGWAGWDHREQEDDLRAWTPPAVRRGRRRGGGA